MLGAAAFWKSRRAGCLLLGLLTLAFFGDLLFGASDRVLSKMGTDIWRQFAGWRAFGFEQLRQGNFPLWTPLVYGGIPFFSGFQSALLYPPNWLHLLLPLPAAINWGIALHVWWLGTGMLLWMRALGRSQPAALFCAVLLMFCAPHFLHVFAGHITHLCVMAWVPWMMLAISRWRESRSPRWVLLGAGIVAMEILAGHPQYVYFGALAAALYAALLMLAPGGGRARFAAGFAAMYLLGALLTAVQLVPGFEAAGESLRGGNREFSATFSFPPENLLTLLAPTLFGDGMKSPYWGRWLFWEVTAFFGVIGLWCAVIGGIWGQGLAQRRTLLVAAGICVLLAFGSYTPLFDALYASVPGFDLFRGSSKFIYSALLFAVALAGMGLDVLLASRGRLAGEKALAGAGLGVALLLGAAAMRLSASTPAAEWTGFRRFVWETGEVLHLPESVYFGDELSAIAAHAAGRALWLACGALTVAVACTLLRPRRPWASYVLLGAGLLEALTYGARFRESFKFERLVPTAQLEFQAAHPGDYRVVDRTLTNAGMLSHAPDLWGDDPGVLRRYAEFMAVTQGLAPDSVDQQLPLKAVHERWDLLRFAYLFEPAREGVRVRESKREPMRRFELVARYEVVAPERRLLERLFMPDFDVRSTVLLETPPAIEIPPRPDAAVQGRWDIVREDSDEVVVRVSVAQPCILLMTDPWCAGWRVESLSPDPPQGEYVIQPGDFALRAIALVTGEHELRIFYLPRSLQASAGVSACALLLWGLGLAFCSRRERPAAG